jgi:hypothetical protein
LKSTTKGQTEIIGLAVIVIIVVLLIFFISLKSSAGPATKQDQVFTGMAQAFLETDMIDRTQCGPGLQDVIKSCYGMDNTCGGSCAYARAELQKRLDKTFTEKNMPFHLTVIKDKDKKIDINSADNKCTDSKEKAGSGIFVIPYDGSSIFVELGICKV